MAMGMNIQVRLYASLRKWSAEPLVALELPTGCTVREAIISAGVPEQEVAILMRNSRRGNLEDVLADGDDIQLFPAIGGG